MAVITNRMHTGRTPHEREGRDGGEVSIRQGTPKIIRKLLEVEETPAIDPPLVPLEGTCSCQHFEL